MDLTLLIAVVSLILAMSIATERFVEIIKGFWPWLNQENKDPKIEGWRKSVLQLLAVGGGILTALLSRPAIKDVVPGHWNTWQGLVALGLLASGGSGFWNAILSYLLLVKNIKKSEAAARKAEAEARRVEAEMRARAAAKNL